MPPEIKPRPHEIDIGGAKYRMILQDLYELSCPLCLKIFFLGEKDPNMHCPFCQANIPGFPNLLAKKALIES